MRNLSHPTVDLWLDTRRANVEGKYPVKLRVTYRRKPQRYSMKPFLRVSHFYTVKEFKAIMSGRGSANLNISKSDLLNIHDELLAVRTRARSIAEDLGNNFTHSSFKEILFSNRSQESTLLYDVVINKIEDLRKDQINTKEHYRLMFNKISSYEKRSLPEKARPKIKWKDYSLDGELELEMSNITVEYLNNFEKFCLEEELSKATIGIYLRCLRHLYNLCMNRGLLESSTYPFGKSKYEIPTSYRQNKNILSKGQIEKLCKLKVVPRSSEEFARDFWMLSFYCYGANIKDILLFEKESLTSDGNFIKFKRSKTSSRKNDPDPITIYLLPETKAIIKKYESETGKYLFPFITTGTNTLQQKNIVDSIVKKVNKGMKALCISLEFEKTTSYMARYSFANLAKKKAVPYKFIQEAMGHSKGSGITDVYLDSYDNEEIATFTKIIYK